jgi:hypothetical protein
MLHPPYRTVLSKVVPILLMLVPVAASAEVSDKEPSILCVWGVGAAASVVCFLGSCYRRWLAPGIAALPAVWFASLFMEIHSEDVGPHLYNEQGLAYYVQAYLALAFFVFGVILGLLQTAKRLLTIRCSSWWVLGVVT